VELYYYTTGVKVIVTCLLRCCAGTFEERDSAEKLLAGNKKPLAVDLPALLLLHGLEQADIVVKTYGKLNITQSTKDDLIQVITEREGFAAEGHMTMGKDDKGYIRQEISREQITKNTSFLKGILEWTKKNCIVIPCKEALSFTDKKQKRFFDILGKSSLETVLIAKQEQTLILTDDFVLRMVAKNDFNVDGVWTQVLLKKVFENGILKKRYMTSV